MRISYLIILILLTTACSVRNSQSDAFGNFETEPVMVSSEVAGKILSLGLTEGEKVNRDALIALVDTTSFFLQLDQIKAQVAASETKKTNFRSQIEVYTQQINNLQVDQKRLNNLLKEGAATQKQLDDLEGQLKVLEKQIGNIKTMSASVNQEVDVLDAQAAVVRNNLKKCFIYAPITGTVLEKYIEAGELTSPGRSVAKISNLDELILKVYVSGNQLSGVKLGQQVKVLIDSVEEANKSFTGVVSWISPEAEFTPKIIQTREERVKLVYAVKIKVKNDGTLKIGMPGEAKFQ